MHPSPSGNCPGNLEHDATHHNDLEQEPDEDNNVGTHTPTGQLSQGGCDAKAPGESGDTDDATDK
jgi:hypothetical protein